MTKVRLIPSSPPSPALPTEGREKEFASREVILVPAQSRFRRQQQSCATGETAGPLPIRPRQQQGETGQHRDRKDSRIQNGGDSEMKRYATFCHVARECSSLKHLERVLDALLKSHGAFA